MSSTSSQATTLCSRVQKIMYFVAQGSVLELLLFNIDLTDLLLEGEDNNVNSYADNPTPYSCTKDMSFLITELQIAKTFSSGMKAII